jgi:hypothetical protein
VLCDWADDRDLRIAVQFHSHMYGPELSYIDKVGGMRMAGFITTVIPEFVKPPKLEAWGWWTFGDGVWNPIEPPPAVSGESGVVIFDEVDVHDE